MTDEKCPLSNKRLFQIVDECRASPHALEQLPMAIYNACRQAAIEGYKIGHEEGYQLGAESVLGRLDAQAEGWQETGPQEAATALHNARRFIARELEAKQKR